MPATCRSIHLLTGISLSCLVACAHPEQKHLIVEGAPVALGDGVTLSQTATTYFGSSYNCSRPAVINAALVEQNTPEGQTITRQRIRRGSARYQLLREALHDRVCQSVSLIAKTRQLDLVVRQGDILDNRGLKVVDVTDDVVNILISPPKK